MLELSEIVFSSGSSQSKCCPKKQNVQQTQTACALTDFASVLRHIHTHMYAYIHTEGTGYLILSLETLQCQV